MAGCLLLSLDGPFVLHYLFMDTHGSGNMTRGKLGASFFFASLVVHQVPPAPLVVAVLLVHDGPGEGDMTCALPVGDLCRPTPASRLTRATQRCPRL